MNNLPVLRVLAILLWIGCSSACVSAQTQLAGPTVLTYEDCLTVPHKMLKTYPPQCVTPDGKTFVAPKDSKKSLCKDLCGNGTCEEMVCMGSGCPCPETAVSCPKDCAVISPSK